VPATFYITFTPLSGHTAERRLGARSPWPSAPRSVMASVDVARCGV
jgi:hypothetical protein